MCENWRLRHCMFFRSYNVKFHSDVIFRQARDSILLWVTQFDSADKYQPILSRKYSNIFQLASSTSGISRAGTKRCHWEFSCFIHPLNSFLVEVIKRKDTDHQHRQLSFMFRHTANCDGKNRIIDFWFAWKSKTFFRRCGSPVRSAKVAQTKLVSQTFSMTIHIPLQQQMISAHMFSLHSALSIFHLLNWSVISETVRPMSFYFVKSE